jgi:hypothetical protein
MLSISSVEIPTTMLGGQRISVQKAVMIVLGLACKPYYLLLDINSPIMAPTKTSVQW